MIKSFISILTVLLVLLSITSTSNAFEKKNKSKTSFGIKTGINYSSPSYDNSFDKLDNIKKLSFGIFITEPLSNNIFIQPEVLYVTKGYSWNGCEECNIDIEGFGAEINITYLEIPILVKYNLQQSSSNNVNIFIGPVLSLQMDATAKWYDYGSSGEEDNDSTFGSNDFGIVVGSGLDIPINSSALTIDLRYTKGVRDIIEYGEMKNSVYSFYLGYRF